MKLDFESDQIVFVCYLAGNSGNFLGRLLSISPELYWGEEFKDDPAMTTTGRAHYAGLFGEITSSGLTGPIIGRDNSNKGRHLGTRDCPGKSFIRAGFNRAATNIHSLPDKFIHPTHLRPSAIHEAFPNAKIIDVRESDKHYSIRLLYEKLWKETLPVAVDQHILDFPAGNPLHFRGVSVSRDNIFEFLFKIHLRYELKYRRKIIDSPSELALVVNHSDLFGPHSMLEYERMCHFIGITPMSQKAKECINTYIKHQWRRALLS